MHGYVQTGALGVASGQLLVFCIIIRKDEQLFCSSNLGECPNIVLFFRGNILRLESDRALSNGLFIVLSNRAAAS